MITEGFPSPCKGCTNRCAVPNCHDCCPEYLEYRAKVDNINKGLKLKQEADEVLIDGLNRYKKKADAAKGMKKNGGVHIA